MAFYTAFEGKRSAARSVRVETNLCEELVCDIKKLTKAGVIKILYKQSHDQIAKNLQQALKKCGYLAELLPEDADFVEDELLDSSEGVVLLGSEFARTFSGEKCIIVVDDWRVSEVLKKCYHTVLVDASICKCEPDVLAGAYGALMSKLVACFDFKLRCIFYGDNAELNIAQQIEEVISDLFAISYDLAGGGDIAHDILHATINCGLLESMLTDMNALNGYNLCAKLARKFAKNNGSVGEYSMLVGWFIVNVIMQYTLTYKSDLFYPADIMADLDFVARQNCEVNRLDLLAIAEKIDAKEYGRLAYIAAEYKDEIAEFIKQIFLPSQNAIKNFRRIYYDCGLKIASGISLKQLSDSVMKGVVFNPYYSYLKTAVILGQV